MNNILKLKKIKRPIKINEINRVFDQKHSLTILQTQTIFFKVSFLP